jgi:Trp operon repressor
MHSIQQALQAGQELLVLRVLLAPQELQELVLRVLLAPQELQELVAGRQVLQGRMLQELAAGLRVLQVGLVPLAGLVLPQ